MIKVEKRLETPKYLLILTPIVSVLVALMFSAILLLVTGEDAARAMNTIFGGSLINWQEVLVNSVTLMILSIGVAVAFKMVVWNIGAAGQMMIGMICAAGVALFVPIGLRDSAFLIPLMAVAAVIGGGLWALISGGAKAIWNVNEVITSLLLNYVALYILQFLVFGPWKGVTSSGFPQTDPFPAAAKIPAIFATGRLHYGLFVALAIIIIFYFLLNKSRWGYEIRVIGEGRNVARYGGMSLSKNIIIAMFVSGGLAGLAGAIHVSALEGRLSPHMNTDIGYTAIIVVWLSRLHPLVISVVSVFMGALLFAETNLPAAGIPSEIAKLLQGSILFFVIAGDFFSRYKVKYVKE